LIQQWLEEVEVATVHQRDRDRGPAQRFCHIQPAESTPDDYYPLRTLCVAFHHI
jgi:hypothetical protein